METIKNPRLIIATDLGRVKAYKLGQTLEGSPHLDLLEETVLKPAHHRLTETVTDLAGRRAARTQRNWRWAEPVADSHEIELEKQRRLIEQISEHVERLALTHPELNICFAAPTKINHLILDALPGKVRNRIEVNLPLDLVKKDQAQLLEHFAVR